MKKKRIFKKRKNQPRIGFKLPFVTLDSRMHHYKLGQVNSKKKKDI
jgi:hypothetical protein